MQCARRYFLAGPSYRGDARVSAAELLQARLQKHWIGDSSQLGEIMSRDAELPYEQIQDEQLSISLSLLYNQAKQLSGEES